MDFATETPTNPLATGTLVSEGEGFCSGKLFYVKNQQDIATIPQGAIIVAEHGEDWMLETSFLQKVGGFIFQQGGTNDHVAITLRQQELPCLIIPDNFAKFKTNNEIVTMACCSFNGVAGAYVVSGNEFADKLATMQSQVKTTYKPRSSETLVIKTPELYFNKPDIAFKNLNDLNYKLLDYFSADSWLTRCFTEKGMLLLAMAPHRIEIIKEATQEIQQMFADFEIFIQGYKQYLQLGIKSETDSKELQQKLVEAEKLTFEFNNIKIRVNNNLDNILQQFTNVAYQTINKADFNQILQDATNIFADTQQLNMPQNIDEVNSLHDCIFWIHKEFIEALAAIAINSNLGIITRYEKVDTIVFSNTQKQQQEQQELEQLCASIFEILDSYDKPKIILMENAVIATIQLGVHACTIEMLEDTEAGKERTLKLKLADNFTRVKHIQGNLKRFWFLVLLLHNIDFAKNASEIKASVEESTGILSIEINHIETKDIMLHKFLQLIRILNSLQDMDVKINKLTIDKENIFWNFSILQQKIAGISSKENQDHFNCFFVILGCIIDDVNKLFYIDDNLYSLLQLTEELRTESNPDFIIMQRLLDNIDRINQENLVFNLCLAKITSITNFAKYKYPQWFVNKQDVITLVTNNGMLLEKASLELQEDIDVVSAAKTENIQALKYASKKLTSNDEFMTHCISVNPSALEFASDNLKNDKGIVLSAVRNPYSNALRYASDDLKNDKDIILVAVKANSMALEYASDDLKNNKDIVLAAVRNDAEALKYASYELKNDANFILESMTNGIFLIKNASRELKSNKEFMLKAIKIDRTSYLYADKSLSYDKQILQAYKEPYKYL